MAQLEARLDGIEEVEGSNPFSSTNSDRMLYWGAIGAILLCALYGLSKLVSANQESITEEEFEAKAKRSSSVGAAVRVLQRAYDPSHHVEYVEEQKHRVEPESAESAGPPKPGATSE